MAIVVFRKNGFWSYVDQQSTFNNKGKRVKGLYYVAVGKGTTNLFNKSKTFKLKSDALKYAKTVIM